MKSPFHQLLETAAPASLGPESRPGRKTVAELDRSLTPLFAFEKLPAQQTGLIRALILLWHDHLDEAHEIAQQIEGPGGSLLHAIMHRRESDYGNARYWFHRVGRHAVFPEVARRAAELTASESEKNLLQLIAPRHEWDPFAFVDACQRARSGATDTAPFLQRLQAAEFAALLDDWAAPR